MGQGRDRKERLFKAGAGEVVGFDKTKKENDCKL